jgi:hypothetical protein
VDRHAILGVSAPGESYLQDSAPFVRENIGRHTVPGSPENWGQSLPPNGRSLGLHLGSVTTVKAEEPWVKHRVSLLISTGANISAIPFSPRPRSSKKITAQGIWGQPLERYFTQPLACSWGDLHFCNIFLIVPETTTPLLGQDLLSKLGVTATFTPRRVLLLDPSRETSRLHSVDRWTHCGTGMNSCPIANSFEGPLLVYPSKTISFKARS